MRLGVAIWVLAVLFAVPVRAGEYDFAIPEAETRPYDLGGRLEFRSIYHRFDTDSIRYRLLYAPDPPGADTHEWHALAELSGGYRWDILLARVRTHHEFIDTVQEDTWDHKLYEAYISATPTGRLTVDAGKKSILWGKGYAWNPAGFINRAKDPDDPSLSLEGRTFLGVDFIQSFAKGSVTNMGFTGLLFPVIDDWSNPEWGDDGDLLIAAKLYLLWHDTDLDFIYFDGPEQPRSYAFDFSKNLAENIEIHGELAFQEDVPHVVIDAEGTARQAREDQLSYLLGVRYLNAIDTTFIAEYYHNGAGYDRGELEDFFAFQEAAFREWEATGDPSILEAADRITRFYYQQRNFGNDYFYFKISQKEPFDILYFNPWAAVVVNLNDFSFHLQPGLTWTPVTNLEMNFRAGIPMGPSHSEFGEKPDAFRPEFWVRYYF